MLNKQSDLDSRYPPSLNSLKGRRDKSNVTWFLKSKKEQKFSNARNCKLSLSILDNRKWRTFHLKEEKGKFSRDRFRFFYAFATVDVLPANNNDKNLDKNRTVQFAWLLNRCLILGK